MPATTSLFKSTDAELRTLALELLDERDMRFFNGEDALITRSNMTAGEQIRFANREPLLDAEGAKVFADATRTYAIPAMDRQELFYFIKAARFCPKVAA